MSYATEGLEDRAREDAAERLARRLDRDLRLRAQRRRSAVFALSLSVVGTLLLVAGLSVAMARDDRRADSASGERTGAATAPETRASVATTVGLESTSEATNSPDSAVAPSPVPTPDKDSVRKAPAKPAAKRATKPAKKASSATVSGPGILIRKCASGGCHSQSEVSAGGLDVESAESVVQAMIDGGHVSLTSAERAAVIAGLTR